MKLRISKATMMAAVEHYLRSVVLREGLAPKVIDVTPSGSYGFGFEYEIELEDLPAPPAAD